MHGEILLAGYSFHVDCENVCLGLDTTEHLDYSNVCKCTLLELLHLHRVTCSCATHLLGIVVRHPVAQEFRYKEFVGVV